MHTIVLLRASLIAHGLAHKEEAATVWSEDFMLGEFDELNASNQELYEVLGA